MPCRGTFPFTVTLSHPEVVTFQDSYSGPANSRTPAFKFPQKPALWSTGCQTYSQYFFQQSTALLLGAVLFVFLSSLLLHSFLWFGVFTSPSTPWGPDFVLLFSVFVFFPQLRCRLRLVFCFLLMLKAGGMSGFTYSSCCSAWLWEDVWRELDLGSCCYRKGTWNPAQVRLLTWQWTKTSFTQVVRSVPVIFYFILFSLSCPGSYCCL